jgi:nonribosomal peptide synthetase DhbF
MDHTLKNLRLDAILPETIRPQSGALEPDPKEVLLTGATGFFGSYLLAELMAKTEATLHCLVRGESREEARQRLINELAAKDLWTDAWAARLVVHHGDLHSSTLGLDDETARYFIENIDAIYHCGAHVSFAVPYSELRSVNVTATLKLIEMVCAGRPKALHHISTLGVFDQVAFFNHRRIEEETVPELLGEHLTGYAASKWVAEQLVIAAQRRGLVATIHRPGTIAGASDSGFWNHTDLIPRSIKACIQIAAVPDLPISISLTPADFVARAVIAVVRSGPPYHTAYHPIADHPVTFADIARWLRLAGYHLDTVTYEAWQYRLRDFLHRGEHSALGALSRLFLTPLPEDRNHTMPELFIGDRRPWYGNDAVMKVLGREGRSAATIDERVFEVYVKRLIADGYLPTPA